MAKRPNYDFEKRRKELARQEKKNAKREERLQRSRDNAENPEQQPDADSDDQSPPA